jgi:hypothetical protein
MNRRTFLKGLFGGVAAIATAQATGDYSLLEPWVPGRRKYFDLHIPGKPAGLMYHPDAFALTMQVSEADFRERYIKPAVDNLARSIDESLSVRFIREFEFAQDRNPARVDVLYGMRTVRPEMSVRVTDLDTDDVEWFGAPPAFELPKPTGAPVMIENCRIERIVPQPLYIPPDWRG